MATVIIAEGVKTLAAASNQDDMYVVGGNALIDTGVDMSGFTDGLHSVTISGAFTGQFGTASAPVKVDVDYGTLPFFLYAASAGSAYVRPGGGSAVISDLQIQAGAASFYLTTGGTVTKCGLSSGTLEIGTPVAVTNYYQNGGNCRYLDDSSTDPTLFVMTSGVCEMQRGATTLTHNGGDLKYKAGSNACTTFNQNGGPLRLQESGTITTFNYFGGTIDTSAVSRPFTITNFTYFGDLPSVLGMLNHPLITITNPFPVIRATGG